MREHHVYKEFSNGSGENKYVEREGTQMDKMLPTVGPAEGHRNVPCTMLATSC